MRKLRYFAFAILLAAAPLRAQTLYHIAENQVPVAMVEVIRQSAFTEVRLKALRALQQVCWTQSGANSPYLLSGGKRYRFLEGQSVIDPLPDWFRCPDSRLLAGASKWDNRVHRNELA